MLKHIYKFLGLVIVFICSVLIFGRGIVVMETINTDEVVKMGGESLPVLGLEVNGTTMNRLFGYSSNMAASSVRESITPIRDDKNVRVLIDECSTVVNKLIYEIRLVSTNELLLSGEVSAFEENEKSVKSAGLNFDINFSPSTEYTLKMTLVTDISKKINYYTRLKYYSADSHLKEKLDFVNNLHDMTISKDAALANYIESDPGADNTTLAKVDINSSFDNITWGNLTPVELTDIVPTIKEYNMETAAIVVNYYARAKMPTGLENFYVKEYYRVKYSEDRMYLLWFERSIETEFDAGTTSVKKSQLKIGISDTTDVQLCSNSAGTRIAFVRSGNLYVYDLLENRINKIYSEYEDDEDYKHELYRQQGIRIMSMDEEGNIRFAVYGYIARGDYEGKVAVVLYNYNMSENVSKELLYIPFDMTFQMLKEEFKKYCYVNAGDVFYFAVKNNIYSYNMISNELTCIAAGLKDDSYKVIPETNSYVWEEADDTNLARCLRILNMDTGTCIDVEAPEKKYVKLIGVIGSNVVYGIGKYKDIGLATEGERILALQNVRILDSNGNVVKKYRKKGYYVVDATVEGNVVYLKRCKKNNKGYVKTSGDNIINRVVAEDKQIKLVPRVTNKALTEWYISLPQLYKMDKLPEYKYTNRYLVAEANPVYLDIENHHIRYYMYAKGSIKAAYDNPADAIVTADKEQGIVIDSNNQVVWERGGRYNSHIISGIDYVSAGNKVSPTDACAAMLLSSVHARFDIKDFAGKGKTVLEILNEYIDNAVNLTGCSFDEVLYYVSSDRPVVAFNGTNPLLITSYTTTTVTIYEPKTGTSQTISHSLADEIFSESGNIFVSIAR